MIFENHASVQGTGWNGEFQEIVRGRVWPVWREPYGCLVGDYFFDHSAPDVSCSEMARVATAAHAPFIAGASPI